MEKRFLLVFVLLMAILASAFATIDVDYKFDIKGLMLEFVLRERTEIPEKAQYENIAEIDTAAEEYKSKLVNLRCFRTVDYSIVFNDDQHAVVVFAVDVAKSFFAVPYPKYDSNSGFSLKLKMVDNNFLGTLGSFDFSAILLTNKQATSFWNKLTNYQVTGKFENVKIKGANFNGSFDSVLYLGDFISNRENFLANSYIKSSLSVTNIKITDNLAINTGFSINTNTLKLKNFSNAKNAFNFSLTSKFAGFTVVPSFTATDFHFNSLKGSYQICSLGLNGFSIFGGKLSLAPGVRLDFNGDKWSSMWVKYYVNTISFVKDRLGISNSTYLYYPKQENKNIETSTTLSYRLSRNVTPSFTGLYKYYPGENHKKDIYVEMTEQVSTHFPLGVVPMNVSFGVMERPYLYQNAFNLGFIGSLSTSVDNLNYTDGEFRLGYKFTWVADSKYSVVSRIFNTDTEKPCPSYVRTRAQFTWFPLQLWGWFNPSFRITATYSNIPFSYYADPDASPEHFSKYFVGDGLEESPKGYGIDYTNITKTILLGEYLRGIRNDNADAMSISQDNLAVVVNMNATAKFIKLGNFADTYVNPFSDLAFIMDTNTKINKKFATIGFEGIGVMKNHPAYPIRVSLGVNAVDLLKFVKNHSKDNLPEYEIYIGLYHFFEFKH